MVKRTIMLLIILSLLAITACDRNASNKEENIKEVENEVNTQPEDKNKPSSDNNIVEDYDEYTTLITHEDNPLLELAIQGRTDGIEFKINDSTDEIIEKWGFPDLYDYFMGGLYFSFDDQNVLFFTDAELDNNDEIVHGNIKCIGVFKNNKEIFNVRIGMTFEEIIAILGEPTYVNTLEQNEESELLHGNWTIVYDVGDYDIEFVSKTENGPVDTVYLWGKN